jgi:hypothetical protein
VRGQSDDTDTGGDGEGFSSSGGARVGSEAGAVLLASQLEQDEREALEELESEEGRASSLTQQQMIEAVRGMVRRIILLHTFAPFYNL